jgi:hypothetical protein
VSEGAPRRADEADPRSEEETIMKTTWVWIPVLMCATLAGGRAAVADEQSLDSSVHFLVASLAARDAAAETGGEPAPEPELPVDLRVRDLSGPRVGVTVAGGGGSVYRDLRDHGMGPVVSQFGWQFEHQVSPYGSGPQFVTQIVPLFGGVEFGKFIPSLTAAVGVRLPSGVEFGAGPSWTLVTSNGRAAAGLVLVGGKTVDYGGVSVPFNLAVSLNQHGTRFTLTTGFAIRRTSS